MTDMPASVQIIDVTARDGLQNDPVEMSTSAKVELIRQAVAAGINRIEVASFVNPRRVPRMADAEAVCSAIEGLNATTIGLALNRRGAARALATQVSEIGAVIAASDGFGIANQGQTSEQTLAEAIAIIEQARAAHRPANVTISVAFGCPFDGVVDESRVVELARRVAQAGPVEIAFGDTIGVATPQHVARLLGKVRRETPGMPLRVHFHDTRNTAIANIWAALNEGVTTIDASIGGLGGCPFAPGATGNVATEDVLYLLGASGVETGVSPAMIHATHAWLSRTMERQLPGKLARVPAFPTEVRSCA